MWHFNVLTQCQAAHRHQSSELKAVMTALKSRDGQLATAQKQLQGLQEADATDKQSLADIIAGLRGILPFCPFNWTGLQVYEMQQMSKQNVLQGLGCKLHMCDSAQTL